MASYQTSLLNPSTGLPDLTPDCVSNLINGNDDSNYTTNTDPGHAQADFNLFRKLYISLPNGFSYIFSSLGDGDATITPASTGTTAFAYTLTQGDGIYVFGLLSMPTWQQGVQFDVTAFSSGKHYVLFTTAGVFDSGAAADLDALVTNLNNLNKGTFFRIGSTIYGSSTVYTYTGLGYSNDGNPPYTHVFPYIAATPYQLDDMVYLGGVIYKSLVTNNTHQPAGITDAYWEIQTEAQAKTNAKYYDEQKCPDNCKMATCKDNLTLKAFCTIDDCCGTCDLCRNENLLRSTEMTVLMDSWNIMKQNNDYGRMQCILDKASELCC